MKHSSIRSASLLVLLLSLIFTACIKDSVTMTYTLFRPVYQSKTEVLANIGSHAPRAVSTAGKIYLYDKYIFLNDVDKGVHIIDNSNPSNPRRVGFIDIPGNIDIAVKGNTLYADIYTDMIAINITDPMQASVTKVIKNVFPERSYGSGFYADSSRYITGWTKKDTTVAQSGDIILECLSCGVFLNSSAASNFSTAPGKGIGGSMARFAIVNNYLYTVNNSSLGAHDITMPADPVRKSTITIGSSIETIYPFKDKLFIGSASGMFVYDITSPALPSFVSMFTHLRACDPVITDGKYAYVTLSTGVFCSGVSNQLDVLNVEDLNRPVLKRSYPLTNPHGLGLDGNLLWICDGKAGLKLFDATVPESLVQLKNVAGIDAYDVILNNRTMIVTAKEGLLQYDYSDINNVRQLSKISTTGL